MQLLGKYPPAAFQPLAAASKTFLHRHSGPAATNALHFAPF